MKIYIFTEFEPFGNERIKAVGKTRKKVEREVRKLYPCMTSASDDTFVLRDDLGPTMLLGRIKEYETVD